MSDPMDDIRGTFFEECGELLDTLETGLLALQDGQQDADTVDSIFRAVHSIKGGAGAFEMGELVAFAHDFETLLDEVRSGRLAPEGELIACFLRAADRLRDLVDYAREGTRAPDVYAELADRLLTIGMGRDAAASEDAAPAPTIDFAPIPLALDLATDVDDGPCWKVTIRPRADLFESGNEPLFLFRALSVLGNLSVEVDAGALPPLADLDVGICYLAWTIHLRPSAMDLTRTEIEAVFEFAADLCDLQVEPAEPIQQTASAPPATLPDLPPVDIDLPADPDALDAQAEEDADDVGIFAEVLDRVAASRSAESAARSGRSTASQSPTATPKSLPGGTTIRVDIDRVDRLVNLVGELVISQSMLAQVVMRDGMDRYSDTAAGLDDLHQLTRDIQDSVMAIRAQPVKSLFQRMTRIVREAAQATGKEVRLETTGETTEIDKTVVERLADPLTHMIRNAVDHGLETADARAVSGKSPVGTVRLTARQQADRVVIEVSDDGKGIDRARVLARAVERGLVDPGATPDDGEIDRLIFQPGFSTNDEVSNLSGRGVGMDVVQQSIRALNGTVAITSEAGQGSKISISLPLTLAILDGMIVRAAEQRLVVPLSAIVETQTFEAARIETIGDGRDIVSLHGNFVPLVDLAAGMGYTGTAPDAAEPDRALLFVHPEDCPAFALCVDAIEAQRQVVIKGLGDTIGQVPCVSAATILGDGQVALIVDPAGFANVAGLTGKSNSPHLPEALAI